MLWPACDWGGVQGLGTEVGLRRGEQGGRKSSVRIVWLLLLLLLFTFRPDTAICIHQIAGPLPGLFPPQSRDKCANLTSLLRGSGEWRFHPHFTDEETEALNSENS